MKKRIAASLLCLLWTFATFGQTAAERLQKGIYAQDTRGDLDAAIQVYREIITTSPSQRAIAAQAQFRLTQALLQKGDLTGAGREFQTLAANYQEYSNLFASMSRGRPEPSITLGTLNNGVYEHALTGIRLILPERWRVMADYDSSGGGQQVALFDEVSRASGFVWMKKYDGKGNLDAELRGDLESKSSQRSSDWKVRPESVQVRTVAGERALSAAADYNQDGRQFVEYLTWIRTTRSRLLYSLRMPAADFEKNKLRLDDFLSTVRIP